MIIRNFVADTPEDAYQMARRALGPEAIILSTATKRQGNWITRWFRAPVVEVIAGKPRPRAVTHPGFQAGSYRGTPSQPPMPASALSSAPPRPSLPPPAPVSSVPPAPVSSVPPAPVASVPPPAPVPAPEARKDSVVDEVKELKAQVQELADLKGMLEKVLSRSSELSPAPVAPEAVQAIEAMKPPSRLPETVRGLLEGLKRCHVDGAIRQKVKDALLESLDGADLKSPTRVYEKTLEIIADMIPVGPDLKSLSKKHEKPMILALVGPTGVGKTTTLAKLAAAFQFQHGMRAAFVTLDTYRIAAPEQLKQYAEIIDIPIKVAFKPEDLRTAVRAFSERDVILVDTVGRSHRNKEDIDDLRRYLGVIEDAEVHLVLSANTKLQDLKEAYGVFKQLGVKGLVMTKLDETSSYGDMVNLVIKENLPVHFVTTGQSVPDDIQAARSQDLARLVTPTPPTRKRRRKGSRSEPPSRPRSRPAKSEEVAAEAAPVETPEVASEAVAV